MIKVFALFMFFFAYALSYKCDLNSLPNRSRPDLDLNYLSQSGNFAIHYDGSGSDAPISIDENNNLTHSPHFV